METMTFLLIAAKATTKVAKAPPAINWVPVWVAVVTGTLAIVLAIVKFWLDRRAKKDDADIKAEELQQEHNNKQEQAFSAMAEYVKLSSTINPILTSFMMLSEVDRVCILKMENGGGVPSLGGKLYTSVAWEVVDPPAQPIIDLYLRQRLDQKFIDVMAEMFRDGYVRLDVENGDYGNIANNYFKTFGIKETEYHYIFGNESKTLCLCFEFMKEADMERPELRTSLSITLTRLRTVISKMDKLRIRGGLPPDFDKPKTL